MISNVGKALVEAGYMKDGEVGNPLTVFLRLLAKPVVLICLRNCISPNVVTLVSLILGITSALLYLIGAKLAFIILWSLSVILDLADGVIARKSGRQSYFGYLFDMISDRIKLAVLVVTWSFVIDEPVSYIISIVILSLLCVLELITHIFVKHLKIAVNSDRYPTNAFHRVFLTFDMHTFFVYGFGILLAGGFSVVVNAWLILVLALVFFRECNDRLFYKGKFACTYNPKIINYFLPKKDRDEIL